jgi:hypothetical protein
MKRLILTSLSLFSLMGCSGAPTDETPAPSTTAPTASAQVEVANGALLADVALSATHSVKFFAITDTKGFISETFSMDTEKRILAAKDVKHGHYAELYEQLAGDKVDAAALERLEVFDGTAQLAPDDGEVVSGSTAEMPAAPYQSVASESVEKDVFSDIDFFRNNACGGCVGRSGSAEPGLPGFPVCTTAPEICWFFNAGRNTIKQKTRNADVFTGNFSFTDSSELIIAENDPCEHTPWPQSSAILFPNGCWNDGTQIGRMVLAPRTTQGGFITSSTTWTLNYVLTGGEFTALKIDLF